MHPCSRHWSWSRTIPSSAISRSAGSHYPLRFVQTAQAPTICLPFPAAMPPTGSHENDQPFTSTLSKLPWCQLCPRPSLPRHKKFITYSTHCSLTLWDMSTYPRLALRTICSIAFSPDDRFLAIGGEDGKTSSKVSHVSSVSADCDISESKQLRSPFRIGFDLIVSPTLCLPGT